MEQDLLTAAHPQPALLLKAEHALHPYVCHEDEVDAPVENEERRDAWTLVDEGHLVRCRRRGEEECEENHEIPHGHEVRAEWVNRESIAKVVALDYLTLGRCPLRRFCCLDHFGCGHLLVIMDLFGTFNTGVAPLECFARLWNVAHCWVWPQPGRRRRSRSARCGFFGPRARVDVLCRYFSCNACRGGLGVGCAWVPCAVRLSS